VKFAYHHEGTGPENDKYNVLQLFFLAQHQICLYTAVVFLQKTKRWLKMKQLMGYEAQLATEATWLMSTKHNQRNPRGHKQAAHGQ